MSRLFDKLVGDHRPSSGSQESLNALIPNTADISPASQAQEKKEQEKEEQVADGSGVKEKEQNPSEAALTADLVGLHVSERCPPVTAPTVDLVATETKDSMHPSSWSKILMSTTEYLDFVKVDESAVRVKDRKCSCFVFRDFSISQSDVVKLEPRTRVNRFSEMNSIAGNKCSLFRQLNRLRRIFPSSFDFFPPSWNFPAERKLFQTVVEQRKFYILKPGQGSQGKGIKIARGDSVMGTYESMGASRSPKATNDRGRRAHPQVCVQEVIEPQLIEQCKFDLRLYVMVSLPLSSLAPDLVSKVESVDPPRAFLFRSAMLRRCMEEYQPPHADVKNSKFSVLTNTSINKKYQPEWASRSASSSCKMPLHTMFETLRAKNRRRVRGFDILVDSRNKPFLLEINSHPSMAVESSVDSCIKRPVLGAMLGLLCRKEPETLAAMLPEMKAGGCLSLYSKDGMEKSKQICDDVSWARRLVDPVAIQESSRALGLLKNVLRVFESIKLLDSKNKIISSWHPCTAGNNYSAAESESPSRIGPYGVWVFFSALLKLGMDEEDILEVFQMARPKKRPVKTKRDPPPSQLSSPNGRDKQQQKEETAGQQTAFGVSLQELQEMTCSGCWGISFDRFIDGMLDIAASIQESSYGDAEDKLKDDAQEEGLIAEIMEGLVLAISVIINEGTLPDHVQHFFTDLSSVRHSELRNPADFSLSMEEAISP
ncbi:hypothetical protein GUITHDRAFT_144918 [Guillardia theta CCMP2712]|uniref:ATP-grasp domain-containing protein n=1 Tax=Guillardia theta (strain CCMP2712) TaxID=905079 RepID=L1INK8_GUITC|nr:hypothetical protein GUITHDRAFT_144918 [Guillardia theta CCMP2712]EKX37479.1 hypothetical protein GUITHDRAFT_144918 [Guillardia theta CCMP2712]|eukprot:XP_005824459.1 hypothetical protein GUITHDRAFT_144918 [Guillardia theta CCMP2712]